MINTFTISAVLYHFYADSYIIRVIPFYMDYFSSQSLDLSVLQLFGPGFLFKTASRANQQKEA